MASNEQARRTQRLGAYAVVVLDDERGVPHLLLTRVSPTGYPAGWWALPGGGVEHGESPHDAVLRELREETGLTATSSRLVDVHDVHTIAPGRGDRLEDYHGVHLLYRVTVVGADDAQRLPEVRVEEVDGTADLAAWLPVADLDDGQRRLLPAVRHALENLGAYR